ncbi:hypothetical protein L6452_20070 [Arctium lappa]|uniref:Uncharacterized protein n=1 Tax=Arctium lappa TaxID=4217 RepID=A0ACB9BBL6_ARCLA|nr:hypothetical protein L6452_20070 [Arctium lappa]
MIQPWLQARPTLIISTGVFRSKGDSTAKPGGDNSLSVRNADEEVSKLVEQGKELQESASTLISRNSQEEAPLRQRALTLDSNIKMLRSFIAFSVKKGKLRILNWSTSNKGRGWGE